MSALATYIDYAFGVVVALVMTAFALMLIGCIVGLTYALYKGATDETWR